MWTALEDFIVVLFVGHRISNHPHQILHHILRSYHCGSSICSMLASREIQLFIVWEERHELCSNYVFEESIWKAGRMKRDMLAFLTRSIAQCQSDKPRHSALNKWWIYTKNDCLPFAKTLPPHCSFKKGTSHTWNSAFKAFFNQQQELAWSEIRYFFSYTYVVIYWLLQRKSGNSTPVPFGNMENLLSAEQIKIIRE